MEATAEPIARAAGTRRSKFYVWMAWLTVFLAFAGFAPTFWAPMAAGAFRANPIVFIHGFAMSGWTLFLLSQALHVAGGDIRRHRAMGMVGIAIATAIVIVGYLVALNSIHTAAPGLEARVLSFSIVPILGITIFAAMLVVAFANTHRPEVHKRLLFVATFGALQAAVGRWFLLLLAPPGAVGPPPIEVTLMAALVVDLCIAGMMMYDWRTLGRVHPALWISGVTLFAEQILVVPLSKTDAWMAFATWFAGLAGS